MIAKESTIGELVAEKPSRSRVFQKHNIDFCCGGKLSIEEACARKKIDPVLIYADLEAENQAKGSEPDWTKVEDVCAIIEHILTAYHEPLKEDLARLDFLSEKVAGVHGDRHPELLSLHSVWASVSAELESHLMKEEQILFPMMLNIAEAAKKNEALGDMHCGTVANPIRQMEFEHENVGTSLLEMRRLTNDYKFPDNACNSFRALYDGLAHFEEELHKHIHLENYVLHPLAERIETHVRNAV